MATFQRNIFKAGEPIFKGMSKFLVSRWFWLFIIIVFISELISNNWGYGLCNDPENAVGDWQGLAVFYVEYASKSTPNIQLATDLKMLFRFGSILAFLTLIALSMFSKQAKVLTFLFSLTCLFLLIRIGWALNYEAALHSCKLNRVHENIPWLFKQTTENHGSRASYTAYASADGADLFLYEFRFAENINNGCVLFLLTDPRNIIAERGGAPRGWVRQVDLTAIPKFDGPYFSEYWRRLYDWGLYNVRKTDVDMKPAYTIVACQREERHPEG